MAAVTMRARAFVLMKRPAAAKSRLGSLLTPEERALLSLAMLRRVLLAAGSVEGLAVTVAGGDESVRSLAVEAGAEWRPEPGAGLNPALDRLLNLDEDRVRLYLPADLPMLTAVEVEQLVASGEDGGLTIAPDRHGTGTNALALGAGHSFQAALGQASFQRHLQRAAQKGMEAKVLRLPGLQLDIDTAEDLEELLRLEPDFWQAAASLAAAAASTFRPSGV